MSQKSGRLPLLISMVTAALLLAVIFWHVDMNVVREALRTIHPSAILCAFLLLSAQSILLALRWHILIRLDQPRTTIKSSLHTTFLAQAVNATLLGGVSGVLVRIGLSMRQGMALNRAICASLVDRLCTVGALGIYALLSLPFVAAHLEIGANINPILMSGVVVALIVVGIFFTLASARMVLPWLLRRHVALVSAYNYVRKIMRLRSLIVLILISLLAQMLYFGAVLVLFRDIQVPIKPLDFFMVMPWITLLSSLPLSFGSWGLREMAFILGFRMLAIPVEKALVVSIQTGLISLFNVIALALPMLLDRQTFVMLHDLKNQTQNLIDRYRQHPTDHQSS